MRITPIISAIVLFFFLVMIIWRLASQRISIPCPAWLYWLVELDNPFAKACHANVIIDNLDLAPGMKVLDAGAGSGRVTIPLAEKCDGKVQVTAMDIQQDMLSVIQKKAQVKNLDNIQLLHAGLGTGKLEQNYYDRAVLVTVLGEIPDQHAAFQEIYNALKSGGILSVSEMIFDPHFQRMGTVIALANAVGFEQKKIIGNRFAYTMQFAKSSKNN